MDLQFLEEERVMMLDIRSALDDIQWGVRDIISARNYMDTSNGKKISRTLVCKLLQDGIKNFERGVKSFEYFKDNIQPIEDGVLKGVEKIKKDLYENQSEI